VYEERSNANVAAQLTQRNPAVTFPCDQVVFSAEVMSSHRTSSTVFIVVNGLFPSQLHSSAAAPTVREQLKEVPVRRVYASLPR